jgi:hypothetical protein
MEESSIQNMIMAQNVGDVTLAGKAGETEVAAQFLWIEDWKLEIGNWKFQMESDGRAVTGLR